MKYLILVFTLLFPINSFADYKVYASQNQKINIPEKSGPWEAPSGEPALHPNGVTITCLDMPDGSTFNLNGETYRVVYSKEDAVTYAAIACTSNLTDLSRAFNANDNFNENISHWDTSNVKNMKYMFKAARIFNQDIGNWDTSKVINMGSMFDNADKFNKSIGEWDTSSVEDMSSMFINNSGFNQDIGAWNTSSVVNMKYMFSSAYNFNQDLSMWCVNKISSKPSGFDQVTNNWILPRPNWGNCPQ